MAEAAPGVGAGAARLGIAVHHVVAVAGDDQHDEPASQRAQQAADGAGLGKVGAAGNDKRPPAYAGAKGQRPGTCGAKIGCQPLRFISHRS